MNAPRVKLAYSYEVSRCDCDDPQCDAFRIFLFMEDREHPFAALTMNPEQAKEVHAVMVAEMAKRRN